MTLNVGELYELLDELPIWAVNSDPWEHDLHCWLEVGDFVILVKEHERCFTIRTRLGEFVTTIQWHCSFRPEEVAA